MEQNTISQDTKDSQDSHGNDEFRMLIDNMNFMRMAVEKTRRDFDPGTAVYITWGLTCMIGYTSSHFLIAAEAYSKINAVWLGLYACGVPLSILFGYRLFKKMMVRGMLPYIYIQIGWIWGILILSGVLFGNFGLGKSFFTNINFFWAWVYAVALCMTGLVYSKEFMAGGLFVFAGMAAAVYLKQYELLVLGAVMGAGCIVPSLITLNRLRRAG